MIAGPGAARGSSREWARERAGVVRARPGLDPGLDRLDWRAPGSAGRASPARGGSTGQARDRARRRRRRGAREDPPDDVDAERSSRRGHRAIEAANGGPPRSRSPSSRVSGRVTNLIPPRIRPRRVENPDEVAFAGKSTLRDPDVPRALPALGGFDADPPALREPSNGPPRGRSRRACTPRADGCAEPDGRPGKPPRKSARVAERGKNPQTLRRAASQRSVRDACTDLLRVENRGRERFSRSCVSARLPTRRSLPRRASRRRGP